MRRTTVAGAGAVLGGLTGLMLARLTRQRQVAVAGRGLLAAGGVYVLGRRYHKTSQPELAREVGALAAELALASIAARMPDRSARATLATGWAAHAAFDLAHRRGDGSLVPDWYPPLCVGFDITLATTLLMPGRGHRAA